jgi:hypothetical protein
VICVCVCEREREREGGGGMFVNEYNDSKVQRVGN